MTKIFTKMTKLTVAFSNYAGAPKPFPRKGVFVLLREP